MSEKRVEIKVFIRMKVWQVGGASAIGMSVAWLLVASVAINNRTICSRALEGLQEKYTHGYSSKNLTVDLDGPVYAAWKWDGRIERTDFESNLDTGTWSVAFKILESKLFVRGNDEVLENTMSNRVFESRYNSMVELLLLAIHMYDIPDMDFIVDFSDGVECGRATFSYFLNTACVNAGFSLPSNAVYMEALGPQQLDGLSKCFQYEYPYHARDPKGLWHLPVGNATDNNENLFDISNMELESVAMRWPTLMAAVPANQVQVSFPQASIEKILYSLKQLVNVRLKHCNLAPYRFILCAHCSASHLNVAGNTVHPLSYAVWKSFVFCDFEKQLLLSFFHKDGCTIS